MQFAMFPTDKGASASPWVSRIIRMIRESGYTYKLTAMATVVETPTFQEAQQLLGKAYSLLENDCDRVYCSVNFDIRKGPMGRIEGKIRSVEEKIGEVSK